MLLRFCFAFRPLIVSMKKQNVSSAFFLTSVQTILEDEVDDPVYQVGP